MAQGKAEIGHNSEPLTDDELAALSHYYADKIRKAKKAADVIKATYDAARSDVNSLFAAVKSDLRYSRKDFEAVLAAQAMTEVEFLNAENKRRRMFAVAGLPVGEQLDLFATTDTVDEKAHAEAEGYRAGRRADDPVSPAHVAPILHPDWMAGWHRGQEANAADFLKAQGILDARKAAEAEASEPEVVGDEPEEDEEEAIDKAARRLRRSGFTERSPAEAEPETVPA